MSKIPKSKFLRRKQPGVSVTAADATTRPSGAMIHMDNIAMEPGSEASKAARYCLSIHDEKTDYFMIHHSHAREADAVVDAAHRFHDAQPELRR